MVIKTNVIQADFYIFSIDIFTKRILSKMYFIILQILVSDSGDNFAAIPAHIPCIYYLNKIFYFGCD